MLTAKIVKGAKGQPDRLVVEIEMTKPTPSASGKTLSVASSHGNQKTEATLDGKPIVVGLNAYVKP